MWNSRENTYDSTDVNKGGGKQYGSDIHGVTIQTNKIIWDMIKELDAKEYFGFYFTAKLSVKKTIIIMYHEDEEMLEKGKHLLHDFQSIPNILFLAKIKKAKDKQYMKLFLIVIAVLSILMGVGLFIYDNKEYFIKASEALSPTSEEKGKEKKEDNNRTDNIQKVEIDIKTLKALKSGFIDQKDPLQEKITKGMEMGVAIMSAMVSDEEKAKYSSKDLVNSFKGKGGIEFVLKKDENMSDEEFNVSVKELNSYAMGFVNDANTSQMLEGYSRVLKSDKSAKKDDLALAYNNIGDLYLENNETKKAEKSYEKSLKLTKELAEESPEKYSNGVAYNLTKLSHIHKELENPKLSKEEIDEAEQRHLKVLSVYRELVKKSPEKFQKNLAWSLNMLANFYHEERENFEKSIKYREEAMSIYIRLVKVEPKSFNVLLFQTINSLAKSYSSIGKLDISKKYYIQTLSILESISKEEGDKKKYLSPMAKVHNSLAWISLSKINPKVQSTNEKEAKEHITEALRLVTPLDKKIKSGIEATSNFYLGYISILKGDLDGGMDYYLKSFNLQKRFTTATSYVSLLVEKKRYLKAKEFFDNMLKRYTKKEQQAKIWLMYGKFYLDIDSYTGQEKLKKSFSIYNKISKDKNSTEYRELITLMDNNVTD